MTSCRPTRRDFLKRAGLAAGAFYYVPAHVLGGRNRASANEKLNIAGIGVGGMGFHNITQMETENIVAICDVDQACAARAFERYPNAARYSDFRVMLDKQKDLSLIHI